MEGSTIIIVVKLRKCCTIICKNQRQNPRALERRLIYDYCQAPTSANRERRPYNVSGALFKETQDFGRTDAGLRAVFTAQRLNWHGPQYNSFPLLYNVTLGRELI